MILLVTLIALVIILTIWETDVFFGWVIVAFIVFFSVSGIYSRFSPSDYNKVETRSIVAVNDDSRINGRFGLFSGVIDDNSYYIYYYSRNGVIRQDKVKVEKAVVIEERRSDAVLEHYRDVRDGPSIYAWWFPEHDYYELHVPEGTVVRKFTLDLNAIPSQSN